MATYVQLDPNGYPDGDEFWFSANLGTNPGAIADVALFVAPFDFTLDDFRFGVAAASTGGAATATLTKTSSGTALSAGTVISGSITVSGLLVNTSGSATNTGVSDATRRVTKGQTVAVRFSAATPTMSQCVITVVGRRFKVGG